MKAKICLVNPKLEGPYPPLGLAYIAGYLRKYGKFEYEIKIIDGNISKDIFSDIMEFEPDIVGFGALSPQIKRAISLSIKLKDINPKVLQVIGGTHISSLPKETLERGCFDIGVIGEGEVTFLEIVDTYLSGELSRDKLKRISGIVFMENGEFINTGIRKEIENLDSIPFPARDIINMEHYLSQFLIIRGLKGNGITTIHTSRGCPYNCIFCSSKAVFNSVRYFSANYVVSELKELVDTYKVKYLYFTDDTFILNKKRVRNLCEAIINVGLSNKIQWEVQARAELVEWNDMELFKLMKDAGCIQVDYGFESGCDRVLRLIKKQRSSVAQNQLAIDVTNKAGLHVMGTFIVGTPTETLEELEMTKEFILKNIDRLDSFQTFIATPFPGTELYKICSEKGIVEENYLDQIKKDENNREIMVYTDTVPKDDVIKMFNYLNKLALNKIDIKSKLSWFIYNFMRSPVKTTKKIIANL